MPSIFNSYLTFFPKWDKTRINKVWRICLKGIGKKSNLFIKKVKCKCEKTWRPRCGRRFMMGDLSFGTYRRKGTNSVLQDTLDLNQEGRGTLVD